MAFKMTRTKNRRFLVIGFVSLLVSVAIINLLAMNQRGSIDLSYVPVWVRLLVFGASLLFAFIFFLLLGIMTSWVNLLLKLLGDSHQGNHLRRTFPWMVFTDERDETGNNR